MTYAGPTLTCSCTPEDFAYVGKITITGHHEECPRNLAEPRQYVWETEGYLRTGTIADYAHDLEEAHYCGIGVSPEVKTWPCDAEHTFKPEVAQGAYDARGYALVEVRVGNELATFHLDGRS